MEVQNEQEDELLIMPSSKPFSSPSLSPPPPSSLSSSPPSSTPSAVSPQSTPGSVSGGENEKKKKYKSGHHLAGSLLAGLKVLRLYFVKQYITVEGKPALKKKLLAFYPNGLKIIVKPSKDYFTPEYIFDLLESAPLIKFNEITRFRFDSGKSEFEFAHRNPRAPPSSVSQDYVFVFKTACVNDIKDTVLAILDFLKGVSRQRSSALSASAKTSNKASDSKSVKGKTRPQTPPETIPTPSLTKATQVSKKSTNGTERPKPTSN